MSDPVKKGFPIYTPMIVGVLALGTLVGGFGYWSMATELSGAIVAGGQIEVAQNRQVVQHPDGGVVNEILVDEGDVVEAGETLIRLDSSSLETELSILEGQLYEIMARRGRLEAERDDAAEIEFDPLLVEAAAANEEVAELMDGQERLFQARNASVEQETEQLRKRRGQIDNQVEGIDAQQTALTRQLELIEGELVDQQSLLDRGLAQASRVLALQREEARLSGTQGELTAQKAQAEGRMTEIDLEVLKLKSRQQEEAIARLRDQQYRELELRERQRGINAQLSRMDIKAPVSGIVYNLQVFAPQSVIRPAEPVLFIIPQDRPLVIAARVSPLHIDQLHVGQEVNLRFAALDQRQTPELLGRVTKVSADTFIEEQTKASYYRAEIVLIEGQLDRLPGDVSLVPGMPVDAYIRTADHTPMAYLLKPLSDYFVKAFRES